ncbi:hypothetical protein JVU11DRAFT_7214 [Chiua virens]|nr:hypothetical protein JVU11DRAFT_7214 [Chiua virens]
MSDQELALELGIRAEALDGLESTGEISDVMDVDDGQVPTVHEPPMDNQYVDVTMANQPNGDVRAGTLGTHSSRAGSIFSASSRSSHTPGRVKFKLLYIPDPTRQCNTLLEAKKDLGFSLRSIPTALSDKLIALFPNHVLIDGRMTQWKDGWTLTYVTEWLWLMTCVSRFDKGNRFEVNYMTWRRFKTGVVKFDAEIVDSLLCHDCVIGGIDYTIDYGNPLYEWSNASEIITFSKNLRSIRGLAMWPPTKQLERAGFKFHLLVDLTLINDRQHAIRPATCLLPLNSPIPDDTVLKRSHSDCGAHVIMPGDAKRRTWSYLRSQTPGNELWLSQEYVDTLSRLGEWRAFLLGGEIIHVVHTYRDRSKGEWHGREVLSYWSLEELKELAQDPEFTPDHLYKADEGLLSERNQAAEAFYTFVKDTWAELVRMEKAEGGTLVSLSVFCRFDIGFIVRNNQPSYFVNEVERSLTTSLWIQAMPEGHHSVFANTFSSNLYRWVDNLKNPYI